jgi:hypothetical protein
MALARIISHSPQCSQALAASLEERGYAVEIVSPDAIPGHPADLELRVETSPDNVLTAKVQTHNGTRSASLDFVHYLNPPMPDFRRKPEAIEPSPIAPPSFALSPTQAAVEKVQTTRIEGAVEPIRPLPPASPEPSRVMAAAPVVLAKATPAQSRPTIPTPAVSTPSPLPNEPSEPARPSWPKVKIIISRFNPGPHPKSGARWKLKRIPRARGWFWQVAVTAAALLLAASLLSVGTIRHRDASPVFNRQDPALDAQAETGQQTDQMQTEEASSLSAHLNIPSDPLAATPAIDHSVVSAVEAGKLKGKESSSTGSKISAASSVKSAASKPLHRRSRTRHADVVAPNTITYFNRPDAKPTVVKPLPQHPTRSKKHDGVVAARSVAALNAKAEPKAGSDK